MTKMEASVDVMVPAQTAYNRVEHEDRETPRAECLRLGTRLRE